ncbi:MAG: flagellar hook-basal body complex protein FliE [Opitutaceae bacterium]|jgi:flagellar hook-basal body complex protein FliE|nr:flagellar hook-basal body complex protein FliE [Opitutaceae bacterium]
MIEANSNIAAQQAFSQSMLSQLKGKDALQPQELQGLPSSDSGESFGNMIGNLVKEVDDKGKVAAAETNKLLLGETDNIHQSMIAMQESGLAFTMLVEVRNKLVQSYQELMRMPV